MKEDNLGTPDNNETDEIERRRILNEPKSTDKQFVGQSLFLFLDYLVISFGGWLYWLVISRFVSVAEIGLATTVYSLIVSTTILTQLGMEYPLLKRARVDRGMVIGTALMIEMIITVASLPVILYVISNLYQGSVQQFEWIGIALLFVMSVEFVFRFALLGIAASRRVFIVDSVGLSIKFIAGFSLTSWGFGALGILVAYLLDVILIVSFYFIFIRKTFSLSIGNLRYVQVLLKDAIVNAPSKYSGQIIFNLSVVLLAYMGVDSFYVGLFYIALVVSVFVGSFASSMAFMVIPASSRTKQDLSPESLRISLSLISPVVVILLVSPALVLSLIGSEYKLAAPALFILALGIVPYAISINVVSKLNYMNKSKNLVILGLSQILIFVIFFVGLVPYYGIIGAAFSILISLISSTVFAGIWSRGSSIRYILVSCFSIGAATIVGSLLNLTVHDHSRFTLILVPLVPVAISIIVILILKSISISELSSFLKEIYQK